MSHSVIFDYVLAFNIFCVGFGTTFQPVDVKVNFVNDTQTSSSFKVLVSGVEWLRSGAVGVRDGGQTWTTSSKETHLLKLVNRGTGSGEDM